MAHEQQKSLNMNIEHLKCAHCAKLKSNHQEVSLACPVGKSSKTQNYEEFSRVNYYAPRQPNPVYNRQPQVSCFCPKCKSTDKRAFPPHVPAIPRCRNGCAELVVKEARAPKVISAGRAPKAQATTAGRIRTKPERLSVYTPPTF